MLVLIHTVPNSKTDKFVELPLGDIPIQFKRFSIKKFLKVYLKAKPINDVANRELLKILRKIFKKDIHIISGKKSKYKLIQLI